MTNTSNPYADQETIRRAVRRALAEVTFTFTAQCRLLGEDDPTLAVRLGDRNTFRDILPYGRWTCADGKEVLFDRSYCPMWRRRAGLTERVGPHWVRPDKQEFFFNDGDAPWYPGRKNRESLRRCLDALCQFGIRVEIDSRAPSWVRVGGPVWECAR